jgi:hypothetical protein
MGHILIPDLPQTQTWREVVALIELGADTEQIANAVIRAAEHGLGRAAQDAGVRETVWLLLHLPHAARNAAYPAALRDLGLDVSEEPGVLGLARALSAAVDARLDNNVGRTDLGEMAQMAGTEIVMGVLTQRTAGLFDVSPAEVRAELGKLATVKNFGSLARHFFARFIFKTLDYFLGRALPRLIGDRRRFATLASVAAFTTALQVHCWEAAKVVEKFSGEWASKERYETGTVSHDAARDFTHGALAKLLKYLKREAGLNGE